MSLPRNSSSTTWFITGASRGFGRELAEQLLARGDRVAATLRRPGQLDDLAAQYGDRLWVRALDVTDTSAIGPAVVSTTIFARTNWRMVPMARPGEAEIPAAVRAS